jgi:hypothetical protein
MKPGYDSTVLVISLLFVGIGVALLVQTARYGGGVGYVLGVLFLGLGLGRIYLRSKRRQ